LGARKAAEAALDAFIETYGIKYEKAVECLTKDRDTVFAFSDFPAEHRQHLLTTNPIESRFATAWRRKAILGVKFHDGIEVVRPHQDSAIALELRSA
jgi:transposase-like protein